MMMMMMMMLTITGADYLVDDANDVSDADDDDDDNDGFVLVLEGTPQLSKWPWRLHLVSTFFLLQLLTRSPVASLLAQMPQVSRDHSLNKRVKREG